MNREKLESADPDKLRSARDAKVALASTIPNEATAQRTVLIDRNFAARPAELFEAWIEPVILARWWGAAGFTAVEIKLDAVVGGVWSITVASPEGKRYMSAGVFREIVMSERLVMFDEGVCPPMQGHATKITVTFEPAEPGTRIQLVQGVFKSEEMRDERKAGWNSSFDKLDGVLRERRMA